MRPNGLARFPNGKGTPASVGGAGFFKWRLAKNRLVDLLIALSQCSLEPSLFRGKSRGHRRTGDEAMPERVQPLPRGADRHESERFRRRVGQQERLRIREHTPEIREARRLVAAPNGSSRAAREPARIVLVKPRHHHPKLVAELRARFTEHVHGGREIFRLSGGKPHLFRAVERRAAESASSVRALVLEPLPTVQKPLLQVRGRREWDEAHLRPVQEVAFGASQGPRWRAMSWLGCGEDSGDPAERLVGLFARPALWRAGAHFVFEDRPRSRDLLRHAAQKLASFIDASLPAHRCGGSALQRKPERREEQRSLPRSHRSNAGNGCPSGRADFRSSGCSFVSAFSRSAAAVTGARSAGLESTMR